MKPASGCVTPNALLRRHDKVERGWTEGFSSSEVRFLDSLLGSRNSDTSGTEVHEAQSPAVLRRPVPSTEENLLREPACRFRDWTEGVRVRERNLKASARYTG